MDDRRQDVSLADISPHLRRAVIAVEDRRFFGHHGIICSRSREPRCTTRVSSSSRGASTITQQLARTLFLSNRRTITRKLQEAVLAVMLEAELSKDQILELYLNRVDFGAGSTERKRYRTRCSESGRAISRSPKRRSSRPIRAPSALSPWSNPDGAMRRSQLCWRRCGSRK